jgi:hypothetical protein
MQNDAVYFRCEMSPQMSGKNFEFVAVKEEIVDGFLSDECCVQLEHAQKLR